MIIVEKLVIHKKLILGSSLVFLFLLGVFLISIGSYPIIYVNGDFITAGTFWKNYRAMLYSYNNISKFIVNDVDGSQIPKSDDVAVVALEKLIDYKLIHQGASNELGADLDKLVSVKIKKISGEAGLKEGARSLYGYSYRDFEREILIPQAESDILSGRLFLDGIELSEWLSKRKRSSRVIIFSSKFFWDGENVKVR
jgi:hypothetical protein